MEDAAKAIELAVGAIMFVIAVTIAIVLYNNLAQTATNALTINETQNSVIYNENEIEANFGYIYTPEDIYYLIKEIKEGNDLYSKIIENGRIALCKGSGDNYSEYRSLSNTIIQNYDVDNLFARIEGNGNLNSRYKIEYEFEYNKKDVLTELNTHKPKMIHIIEYVE